MNAQLDRMENKIDRMDEKLDSHLERISAAEVSIEWLKGHVKFTVSITIAVIGALITYIFTHIK